MNRRNHLKNLALTAGSLAFLPNTLAKAFTHLAKAKTILLASDWQYWNIGDMTHTTGILHLLNLYLPDTQIILWPRREESRQQDRMLMQNFPDLKIVYGAIDKDGNMNSEPVLQAADQAEFLLHSSGSGLSGAKQVVWWKENVKKPYGFYGVSVVSTNHMYRELISNATFIFTRETQSLIDMKEANIKCKTMEFAPDSTFASHVLDEKKAIPYLQANGLEYKKFICVIPRLRVTPYFEFTSRTYTEERKKEITELNNAKKEEDHAKAREAIITWVRQTGNPVLVCPEMVYQIGIMDELLINPLPEDVKNKVIKRDTYWLPDEASTIYKNATALISFECHSPIMAAYNGTPAFYLRQPEDTIKGQMWYDIGLSDWVFEIEQTTGEQISNRLMEVYDDYSKSCQHLEAAMDYVREVQYESMSHIREFVNKQS